MRYWILLGRVFTLPLVFILGGIFIVLMAWDSWIYKWKQGETK